ncbi:MAG: guanylate kinase [Acidobacteria bacterium]|nr:guanylate kinase [Acidobacteriota bacterium]MCH8129770.1 guanylate kinase [Acidobacteriota bacterium]MCH8992143.1 guanylate kinase [Acidobacteriota bacterium]
MSASSTTSRDGTLLVVSGPSGVGKSSVVDVVLERSGATFSVSATTRAPRPGERDGEDYLFVTDARFDELVAAGELLEWADYGGHRYGTPGAPVLEHIAAGEDVLLDIENVGAHQVRAAYPDAVLLFILPPSLEELERRLRKRGDTSEQDVERRLAVASEQIEDAKATFDHLVVNDDLQTAIYQVLSILG